MATIIDYIKENELAWQPSFNDVLGNGLHGYRGSLIVEEGKALSAERKLPPKIQARQVIMVSDDTVKFLACELEGFADFEPMFAKYKEFFSADGLYILFVTDLDGNGTFEYEGITFTAIGLDESSVWNELLETANLEKRDMKQFKKNEQKIEKLYDEIITCDTKESAKTYEEMLALVGTSSKQIMGAV